MLRATDRRTGRPGPRLRPPGRRSASSRSMPARSRVQRHHPTGPSADQVDVRVGELALTSEQLEPPEEQRSGAHRELLGSVRLVEEGHPKCPRPVVHDHLDPAAEPARAASCSPAGADQMHCRHLADHPGCLTHRQVGHGHLASLVEVPVGIVGEQVEHRVDTQSAQRPSPGRADPVQHADVDAGQLSQPPTGASGTRHVRGARAVPSVTRAAPRAHSMLSR